MNTNDNMQTTSSASRADLIIAERYKFEGWATSSGYAMALDDHGDYLWNPTKKAWADWKRMCGLASQSIVPPVVQAPIDTAQDLLYVCMELSGVIGEYRSMPCGSLKERMFQTLDRYMPRIHKARSVLSQAAPSPTEQASEVSCDKCGQIDAGQTGEYSCSVCGLPCLWDEKNKVLEIASNMPSSLPWEVVQVGEYSFDVVGEDEMGPITICSASETLAKFIVDACNKSATPADKGNAPVGASEWMPIESAPKDGEMILICLLRIMHLIVRARYNTVHKHWLTDYEGEGGISRPTFFHPGDLWQPMPKLPAKDQA